MLKVTRTGSTVADVLTSVRGIHKNILPYAAATALTRTVKIAQADVVAEMRGSFDRPTAYTLNSTFIVPASKENLTARLAIKNQATGNTPENFLLPGVEGGMRREKRFEAAMRHAGFMTPGQRAMPGSGAKLDANGNVLRSEIGQILKSLSSIRSKPRDKSGPRGRALQNSLFVGKPNGGNRPDGIWRREGHRIRLLFLFTSVQPQYGKRLDFSGTVQQVVRKRFEQEFYAAAAALQQRYS